MSKQKTGSVDLAASDIKKVRPPSADTTAREKRSSTSSTRMGTPTPTSATRPTMSSASRSTPTGGPAKPPARPVGNTVRSRPQSTAVSSAYPGTTNRPRVSVGSAASSTKGDLGTPIESNRNGENKPLPPNSRARSTSPTKPILKPAFGQSVPRRSTTVKSTVMGFAGTRPDVVLASPSVPSRNLDPTNTPPVRSSPQSKMTRPGLGTRKSTMSVTIEQRLQEMSLVHQMLRAAMAEDGNEDDDVKEEYGKQMDDTLAALRLRLEEAKTLEGCLGSDKPLNNGASNIGDQDDMSDATESKSRLEDHDQSNAAQPLGASLTTASRSTSQKGHNLDEVQRLQETIDSLKSNLESLQVSHERQLTETNAAMEAKLLEVQANREREAHRSLDTIEKLRAHLDYINQAKMSLEHDVQQLEASKQRHVEQSQKAIEVLGKQIQQQDDAKARVEENQSRIVSALRQDFQEAQSSKDREIDHLRKAVEDLQETIRDLSEAKEREINTFGDSLASENEKIVHKLQAELDETVAKSKFELELRLASNEAAEQHKKEVLELQIALNESKVQIRRLSDDIAKGLKQIKSLQDAKGSTDMVLQSMEEDLKQKSENAASLRMQLEISEEERQSLFEKNVGAEQELARVSKECRSNQQLAADYQSKLSQFQAGQEANETSIEQLAERKRIVRSLQQTVDTLRQELHSRDVSVRDLQTQLETLRTECESTAKRSEATLRLNISAELEKLAAQLQTAQSVIDQKTTRIRELESALKVTTAELVELKTDRPTESSDSEASSQRMSLRLSRWPKLDSKSSITHGDSSESVAGEELSSHVQGQVCPLVSLVALSVHPILPIRSQSTTDIANTSLVQIAGMQERLRQMDELNSELIEHDKTYTTRFPP
ncbi:MAG: hypothetical protein Q9178_002891 [Gyalolechia marmorata]